MNELLARKRVVHGWSRSTWPGSAARESGALRLTAIDYELLVLLAQHMLEEVRRATLCA